MSEVFQFALQNRGRGRRDEKGRAEVHGLKIDKKKLGDDTTMKYANTLAAAFILEKNTLLHR